MLTDGSVEVAGPGLQWTGAGRGALGRGAGTVATTTLRRLPVMRTEKVLFGKQEVQLPEILVEDVSTVINNVIQLN